MVLPKYPLLGEVIVELEIYVMSDPSLASDLESTIDEWRVTS